MRVIKALPVDTTETSAYVMAQELAQTIKSPILITKVVATKERMPSDMYEFVKKFL